MFKNTGSQRVAVYAWDNAAGSAKTGDAANISAQISKDGAATAATNDVNPTELDSTDAPGIYIFDMTQAETNADLVVIAPVSSTSDIVLRPVIIYTQTVMRGTDSAALAATALTDATWTDAKAGYIDAAITGRAPASEYDTEMARITANVATETKQDIIDTNIDQIETAVITNAAGTDIAADIIAVKAETATIVDDTNELQTDDVPGLIGALSNISVAEIIAGVTDGSLDLQEMLRIVVAACAGKSDGGGSSTIHFRDSADGKNRITATVDANGNRTAMTLDGS